MSMQFPNSTGINLFDSIRDKYGQKFLDDYHLWVVKDSNEHSFLMTMHYYDMNSAYFKRYLLELLDKV